MSCVVHKHVIAIEDTPTAVLLPLDSKVVHVAMQNGAMCLWEEHAEPLAGGPLYGLSNEQPSPVRCARMAHASGEHVGYGDSFLIVRWSA